MVGNGSVATKQNEGRNWSKSTVGKINPKRHSMVFATTTIISFPICICAFLPDYDFYDSRNENKCKKRRHQIEVTMLDVFSHIFVQFPLGPLIV